jgi:hypothetical protein
MQPLVQQVPAAEVAGTWDDHSIDSDAGLEFHLQSAIGLKDTNSDISFLSAVITEHRNWFL